MAKLYEYRLHWLKSVAKYTEETQATVLDLSRKGLSKEEVEFILNVLANSQVTELNLEGNCLKNVMADIAPLLIKTIIQKLNVSECELTKDDVFRSVELLKDSQITDLNIISNVESGCFTLDRARLFIYNVQQSKLTILHCGYFFELLPSSIISSFAQDFWSTSVTNLDFSSCNLTSSDLICLFSNLGRSGVTDLNLNILNSSSISSEALQELSRRLVETKIEKLSLFAVDLDNDKLNILAQGLIGSKVIDLNVGANAFTCLDPIFTKIKETQIRTLILCWNKLNNETFYPDSLRCSSLASVDLSWCYLSDEQGEALMESLRLSNVVKLNVRQNYFGSLTINKLAENIRDIKLVDLDMSGNGLTRERLSTLGGCLIESKLTRINVSSNRSARLSSNDMLSFLKQTEGSSISQIEMNACCSDFDSPIDCELNMLTNTTLTKLHLSRCYITAAHLLGLISCLNSTIVRLDLSDNEIGDEGASVLAECLKETRIRRLNLMGNDITSQGAKVLALSLIETILGHLDLSGNKIEDDGIEFVAEHIKDTFVTELNIYDNPGKRVRLVDKVLWENKTAVHKQVTFFRQIAPKASHDEFCFNPNSDDVDVCVFLEKLMVFYKTVIDKPKAISVLLEDESVPYSRTELCRLLFEEFPRQLSVFIAWRIEADLAERLRILESVEERGLTAIVESLLLHRPAFMLDEGQGILHPYVYKLLLKYKQPVCNLAVEPDGVVKIIDYFTEHADVEGAQDLINLLRGANANSSMSIA